ncbi:MAG TPA: hypothetical protein DF383_00505 [Deltaproteobacteria bacterium]|nr:hypothetical protein [Deltaproteobacteria bacterium]
MIKNFDEFLETSWERNQVVGAWGFNSNMNFSALSPEETNVWFFEQVFNFLRAYFGLVVPDAMELITYNATQHLQKSGLDQQTFLDELMLLMKNLREPLWTFRLSLNIVGFLRTSFQVDNPVRLQIQEPCSFIVWGGPDETGFQNFSISYHLFSTVVLEGQEQELWSINQPILEKALQKWEQQSGHMIDVVDSTGDAPVQQYGFDRA